MADNAVTALILGAIALLGCIALTLGLLMNSSDRVDFDDTVNKHPMWTLAFIIACCVLTFVIFYILQYIE